MFTSQSLRSVVRPGDLAVREQRLDDVVHQMDLKGSLDDGNAPELERRIDAALAGGVRWLIVDLAEANPVGDQALDALSNAVRELRSRRGELILAGAAPDVGPRINVDVVDKLGLPGVFALMVAESACIPIPSEGTMLFAGFNVSEGHYPLWEVVLVATAANVVGSWIAYAVGYYGRVDILEKHGKKLHIKPSHLAWADRWFEKYGSWTVFLTRMLPIIRTFISLPAGVARMPFWRFTALTALGCIPWIFMLTFIGKQVGDNWESWKDSLHYVDYAVAAVIVLGVLYLVVRNRRGKKPEAAADASR